jgi:hypothetical protein
MEQAYLEKMFPNGRELPADRLIPCLLMQGGRTEVIFLIKAGPENAAILRNDNDANLTASEFSIHALPQQGEAPADLRIAMQLVYPDGSIQFHGTISDAEGKKQAAVAKALLLVTRVALFVATHEFEFVSFKAFDWNPASQPVLKDILRKATQD